MQPRSSDAGGGGADQTTLILGAGPGGLCAAYALSRAGVPTITLEKAPLVGGLARTIKKETPYGTFRFDIGGHRWFTKHEELNAIFRDVVGEELLWVERRSRIYVDGHFVDYPLRIGNALRAVGPLVATKAMADYGRIRLQHMIRPEHGGSMQDAFVDQYGHTLYKRFFRDYSEKVWGLPCSRMSGEWVPQRSKGVSLLAAVRGGAGHADNLSDRFMYPKYGFGRFSERMAERVTALGGAIYLSAGVERVHRVGNRVTGVTVTTEHGSRRVEAANFISSVPLTLLVKMIEPAAPADVLAAADVLTFRNIITVNLILRKRQVTPDTWLYVHDRDILFGRFHEPKNWSVAMVPSDDYTSLVAEYFCSYGDGIWTMTEQELVEQTVHHLVDDLGFISRDEVVQGFTVRVPKAYPSYVLGYEAALAKLKRYIGTLGNLQIIGRYGAFRYNNTDHSVEAGLLAAKNVLGEHHDLDQVNAAKEYQERVRIAVPVGAAGASSRK